MSSKILLAATLLFCFSASADERDLFKSVPDAKAKRIREYNEPYFSGLTYRALRYRIVEVNHELLMSPEGQFTINMFEDAQVEVSTFEVNEISPTFGMKVWHGRTPNWKRLVETAKQRPEEERQLVSDEKWADLLTGITFHSQPWYVDKKTGNAVPKHKRGSAARSLDGGNVMLTTKQPGRSTSSGAPREPSPPGTNGSDFRSVDGRFTVFLEDRYPVERKTYSLRPLKYTPKYHLIVEVDESKSIGWIDGQAKRSPEDQKKAAQESEFHKSLPKEDPEHKVKGDVK